MTYGPSLASGMRVDSVSEAMMSMRSNVGESTHAPVATGTPAVWSSPLQRRHPAHAVAQ